MHPGRRSHRAPDRAQPSDTREAYLAMIRAAASAGPACNAAQCANFAHGVAGCGAKDKQRLRLPDAANVAIVTAYNDMFLGAPQPYEDYLGAPAALREIGSVGQVAGGVPAMCDGVTQGEPGMELAIASREVIAMSTAVALSHNLFDAALLLGICDKIVPGLLIGALRFGHLPALFVPAGPMPSGLANKRQGRGAPALRRREGWPRRAARCRDAGLPQPWHLHVLRHRQHQSDADGSDGPAPPGFVLRQSRHAIARCADHRGGAPGHAAHAW